MEEFFLIQLLCNC